MSSCLSLQALIESSERPGVLAQEPNVRLVALYDNEEVSGQGSYLSRKWKEPILFYMFGDCHFISVSKVVNGQGG